jgi:hypothetical protein
MTSDPPNVWHDQTTPGKETTMSRIYNSIDADGHVLEPLELWAEYMDPKYRDHAPRLVRDNKGKERLLIG